MATINAGFAVCWIVLALWVVAGHTVPPATIVLACVLSALWNLSPEK